MNLEEAERAIAGNWASLAPEVRPSAQRNPDGTLKPFDLKREFEALPQDRCGLSLLNSVDDHGQLALARILISGHLLWRGDHPIAQGAEKVDFLADEAHEVTPLLQGIADLLDRVAVDGELKWAVGQTQSVFGKSFAPSGLTAGQHVMALDRVHGPAPCASGVPAPSMDAASTGRRTVRATCRTPAAPSGCLGPRDGGPEGSRAAAAQQPERRPA